MCSLHDGEVFRAATTWSPSLAPTLAVCCELARWQRTRLFHYTDTRKSPHNIRADEVTAEKKDMSQVAGAMGVGAELSEHRSTAWLAAMPYCIYNERLRECLTLEQNRVQDRDCGNCPGFQV